MYDIAKAKMRSQLTSIAAVVKKCERSRIETCMEDVINITASVCDLDSSYFLNCKVGSRPVFRYLGSSVAEDVPVGHNQMVAGRSWIQGKNSDKTISFSETNRSKGVVVP